MEKSPFSRFIELITFDQSLLVLEKELETLDKALETTCTLSAQIDHEQEKERLVLHEMRKYVDKQELEMRSLDEQERIARERAALATTTREYQSFKKECDQFKNAQHEHEEVLVAAWNTFENTQKAFDAKEPVLKEKKAQLLQDLQAHEEKKQAVLEKIAHYELTRQGYTKDLPEEWLEKYNRMRNTVSNPVVPVVSGTCGGCSYLLTTQTLLSLGQNKMIQCTGCYRLLYKNFEHEQKSGT